MSLKTRTVLLFIVSFYSFVFLPLIPLWAQSFEPPENTDIFAPIIQHQTLEDTVQPGTPYKLEAKVTDNIGVVEVILYYRMRGKESYSSVNMESIGQGNYTTVFSKEDVTVPGLEYYIQASDRAGNISQRAFPFSPLVIDVVVTPKDTSKDSLAAAPALPLIQKEKKVLTDKMLPTEREPFALSTEKPVETQEISEKKPWYKKWWVWAIALAVVGGVAAGSGGGGGESAAAPSTGAIDVSGPVP